jgi:hypothetical protein
MTKIHNLEIRAEYALPKLKGDKMFEIRKNDRNYEVGDIIHYRVIDDEKLNYEMFTKFYKIKYITDYAQQYGYVVFGEQEWL